MAIYTVHLPPGEGAGPDRLETAEFVRDGFSWLALFFPLVWLLWHRLWWATLGWLLAVVGIEVLGRFAGETVAGIVAVVFAVWFALVARDIRRWTLERNGRPAVAAVEADRRDEAERRFFDAWLAGAPATAPAPLAPGSPPRPLPRNRAPVAEAPFGLFPAPGGRAP